MSVNMINVLSVIVLSVVLYTQSTKCFSAFRFSTKRRVAKKVLPDLYQGEGEGRDDDDDADDADTDGQGPPQPAGVLRFAAGLKIF